MKSADGQRSQTPLTGDGRKDYESGSSSTHCGYPHADSDTKPNKQLRPGTRIVLDSMHDPHALQPGSQGTVEGYDAAKDLLVDWDSGSSLKLIHDIDSFHTVSSDEEIKVSLEHLKSQQKSIARDDEFECPRCGRRSVYRTRALSRLADVSVCSGCGTVEAMLDAMNAGAVRIKGADEDTEKDFKRITIRDWRMARLWMGLGDID